MGSACPEPPKQPTNGRSGVYRLSSGETDAWVLFDHSIWVERIQQFALGAPDSTIVELMERYFLPFGFQFTALSALPAFAAFPDGLMI
jgi:hypothetical protein